MQEHSLAHLDQPKSRTQYGVSKTNDAPPNWGPSTAGHRTNRHGHVAVPAKVLTQLILTSAPIRPRGEELVASDVPSDVPSDEQMAGSMFLALPPELRLRIYEHALRLQGALQRPVKAAAVVWQKKTDGEVANVALLRANKLIHGEARDVFYEVNRFIVSYNHICSCENEYPYSALKQRMGEMRITNFLPRVDEAQTCMFCQASGFGMFEQLIHLPKLRSVSVAFDDVWSFADHAPTLLSTLATTHGTTSASHEVGKVEVLGLPLRLGIELPALYRAWAALARGERRNHARYRIAGEQTMRRVLQYLRFEADTYARTPTTLLPFFVQGEENRNPLLHFRGHEDDKKRAEFTVALAGLLSEILADDGGSSSIPWADLSGDNATIVRWSFGEKNGVPQGVHHIGFRDEDEATGDL